MQPYDADLARVHHEGYVALARAAADVVLSFLRDGGRPTGTVVDLGCGSGVLAALVPAAGHDVVGVDLSDDMLAIARTAAPGARVVHGSVFDVDLPPASAVVAVGEIFNYAFDPRASLDAFATMAARVAAALSPGGLFLFDAAGPGHAGPTPRHRRPPGAGLAMCRRGHRIAGRRDPDPFDHDVHPRRRAMATIRRAARAAPVRPHARSALLEAAGFRITRQSAYGALALPPGLHAFTAVR